MKLGLATIDSICERLGRPERKTASVLIAGTNGKGSTAAALASIAESFGVRAGLYTSPHLIDVTERIRVEEADVSPEELDDALARVFDSADAAPEVPLTYFEALTAAAFAIFAARRLDLAILEVGLGGRFDATNVAPARVSVITSIGLDHTEELGPTLARIAREKAGVFRRGRPALARADSLEALDALHAAAAETGARWRDASAEIAVRAVDVGLDGTRFELATPETRGVFRTPLPGEHQAWNAGLAVRAAELAREELGLFSSGGSFERGVAGTRWPGRLETFDVGGRRVILDGCHNPAGAAALGRFLDRALPSRRCRLIFGAMADKDVESMAEQLFPRACSVMVVGGGTPRAATSAELLRRTSALSRAVEERPDVAAALPALLARPGAEPVLVAGSLYLVGEARALLLSGALQERSA